MITFGSHSAPVGLYLGPTGRGIIKSIIAKGESSSLFAGGIAKQQYQKPQGSESALLRNENWCTPQAVIQVQTLREIHTA